MRQLRCCSRSAAFAQSDGDGPVPRGAEGEKTAEEAAVYGGTAGEPDDPCCHQGCDDITNLDTKALSELGDGAAHAVMTLARTRTGLFEDGSFRARTAA